jgi:predicted glycoside hydrolase/deacetylase ChbG (UPF0249 family)
MVICADDYAISPAVSAGIRELAAVGRLSATGVMSCMPDWPDEAPALRPLGERISVGLHLTLTDQRPLGSLPVLAPDGRLPSIAALLKASFVGRLPMNEVTAEIESQLDAFEAAFGRQPDFVDGHQHVHLLPGVRRAVLDLFGRRLDPKTCWLRDCTDDPRSILRRCAVLKAGFIALLGSPLAAAARAKGIRTNRGFSGFYDPCGRAFADVFPTLLTGSLTGHLLMVHPGHVDAALVACDGLTEPREKEWTFLMGADLLRLLESHGLAIAGRGFPG